MAPTPAILILDAEAPVRRASMLVWKVDISDRTKALSDQKPAGELYTKASRKSSSPLSCAMCVEQDCEG